MKHFIFDLDGTLIDTETPVLLTWQKTLADYGFDFPLSELSIVLGVTMDSGLQRLRVPAISGFHEKWLEIYALFAEKAAFFDHIKEMLVSLQSRGCTIGAVSSRCRREYRDYFSGFHLEDFFETVILEEDTEKHKPHPAPVLKYLEVLHANAADSIYIGDMEGDVLCANSAGVYSGFAKWNHSGRICTQADFVFDHPYDVLKLTETYFPLEELR